jgi:Domain of unknown function (DUF4926)
MASPSIQLLDVVTLLTDLPERNLFRGQVGTVVEVYEPDEFEVEFVDKNGYTYGLETLMAEHQGLWHWGQSPNGCLDLN